MFNIQCRKDCLVEIVHLGRLQICRKLLQKLRFSNLATATRHMTKPPKCTILYRNSRVKIFFFCFSCTLKRIYFVNKQKSVTIPYCVSCKIIRFFWNNTLYLCEYFQVSYSYLKINSFISDLWYYFFKLKTKWTLLNFLLIYNIFFTFLIYLFKNKS